MIIHETRLSHRDGWVRLTARLESAKHPRESGELWFEFPESETPLVSTRADAFLAASYLSAMRLGEDLEARGEVSPRLLQDLAACQDYFANGRPDMFQRIKVTAKSLSSPPSPASPMVLTAFSGGVDSFFTLLRHLRGRRGLPPHVDCGLLMQGFDIPLSDTRTFSIITAKYRDLLAGLGVRLITGRTNFRLLPITARLDWEMCFSCPLIGAAHALGRGVGTMLVPASLTPESKLFTGASPITDEALATETTTVIHDGFETDRCDKTLSLADEPAAQEALRVCFAHPDGADNCCLCPKCLNVMVIFECCGALKRFRTFPLPLSISGPAFFSNATAAMRSEQIIALAKKYGRDDIAKDYSDECRRFHQRDRFVRAIARLFPKRMLGTSPYKHLLRLFHTPYRWHHDRLQRQRLADFRAGQAHGSRK